MTVKDLLYKIYDDMTCFDILIIVNDNDKLMRVEEIGVMPFSFIKEMAYYNVLIYNAREIGFKNVHFIKCVKSEKDVTK